MKQLLIVVLALLLGAGGGAAGMHFLGPAGQQAEKPAASAAPLPEESEILPPFKVRAPIVFSDGNLSTYARFSVQLVVRAETAEQAGEMQPLVINAINMRTFQAPLAQSPDGQIPSVQAFRDIVLASAQEVLGRSNVSKALVTDIEPNSTEP